MDDIWALHTELMKDLLATELKATEDKVVLQSELDEAWEQVVIAEREKTRLPIFWSNEKRPGSLDEQKGRIY